MVPSVDAGTVTVRTVVADETVIIEVWVGGRRLSATPTFWGQNLRVVVEYEVYGSVKHTTGIYLPERKISQA